MVETEDRVVGKMFARVAFQFQTKLMEVSAQRSLRDGDLER